MEKKSTPIRPLCFIGICSLSFLLIICLPEAVFGVLTRATAYLAGQCIGLFGGHAKVSGPVISMDGFRVEIITECTALYCVVLFGSFVMSVRVSLERRLTGLLLGASFLSAANILRIAIITIVGAGYPLLFESLHVFLMQVVMIILVCAACIIWLRWASGYNFSHTPPDFYIRVIVIASVLFLIWLPVHRGYVEILDRLVIYLFSLMDFMLFIPARPEIYHHTLSLIVFASLIFAAPGVGARRKVYQLTAGLLVLVLVHILFRTTQVLITAMHIYGLNRVHIAIHLANQYLLPVVLWLVLARREKTRAVCPLCGAEKAGMLQHITAVHGAAGLKDLRVRRLLEEIR